jgi:DsbC/DsbD-like thiol-disulfide interchange protein
MKRIFLLLLVILSLPSFGQDLNPVSWTFTSAKDSTSKFQIIEIKASIQPGWHVFTADPGGDGLLIPTTVTFDTKKELSQLSPMAIEGNLHTEKMDGIGIVNYYDGDVYYRYKVEVNTNVTLTGKVEFQTCNNQMCLPPKEIEFTINLKK